MKTKGQCELVDEMRKQPDAAKDLTYFETFATYAEVPPNQRA